MKRVRMLPQPNDVTCGPTCLHAIYDFYGETISLETVISQVRYLSDGGTLGVYLGLHALSMNYEVTLNVINPEVFDPTWFIDDDVDLIEKLNTQLSYKTSRKLRTASLAFIEFIEKGGKLISHDISSHFLKTLFEDRQPILTGLSATYLYRCKREVTVGDKLLYDDIRGTPSGHFVVLNGYDMRSNKIVVADPYDGPSSKGRYYEVRVSRLINSIMLGALTYDANFLLIKPKD